MPCPAAGLEKAKPRRTPQETVLMAQEQREGGNAMGEGSAAPAPSSASDFWSEDLRLLPNQQPAALKPGHPEPRGQTYFPARLNAIHTKRGLGIRNNNLPRASPHGPRRPAMCAGPGRHQHINAMEHAVRLGQAPAPAQERDTRSSICVCLSQGENLIKHGVGAWRSWGWGWNIKRGCFPQIRGQY